VREIFLIGTEPFYERAAMGMAKYETIVECPDEAAFLERVAGRPLIGVERDHARTTLWEAEMPRDLVLLFGSEDDGLPPSLLVACQEVIAIPMYGINHSFPVAISAGMVLCEWARRRDPRGRGR
jgi:tRNA G18 (ribose-2'-O)-methylase SpoU